MDEPVRYRHRPRRGVERSLAVGGLCLVDSATNELRKRSVRRSHALGRDRFRQPVEVRQGPDRLAATTGFLSMHVPHELGVGEGTMVVDDGRGRTRCGEVVTRGLCASNGAGRSGLARGVSGIRRARGLACIVTGRIEGQRSGERLRDPRGILHAIRRDGCVRKGRRLHVQTLRDRIPQQVASLTPADSLTNLCRRRRRSARPASAVRRPTTASVRTWVAAEPLTSFRQ